MSASFLQNRQSKFSGDSEHTYIRAKRLLLETLVIGVNSKTHTYFPNNIRENGRYNEHTKRSYNDIETHLQKPGDSAKYKSLQKRQTVATGYDYNSRNSNVNHYNKKQQTVKDGSDSSISVQGSAFRAAINSPSPNVTIQDVGLLAKLLTNLPRQPPNNGFPPSPNNGFPLSPGTANGFMQPSQVMPRIPPDVALDMLGDLIDGMGQSAAPGAVLPGWNPLMNNLMTMVNTITRPMIAFPANPPPAAIPWGPVPRENVPYIPPIHQKNAPDMSHMITRNYQQSMPQIAQPDISLHSRPYDVAPHDSSGRWSQSSLGAPDYGAQGLSPSYSHSPQHSALQRKPHHTINSISSADTQYTHAGTQQDVGQSAASIAHDPVHGMHPHESIGMKGGIFDVNNDPTIKEIGVLLRKLEGTLSKIKDSRVPEIIRTIPNPQTALLHDKPKHAFATPEVRVIMAPMRSISRKLTPNVNFNGIKQSTMKSEARIKVHSWSGLTAQRIDVGSPSQPVVYVDSAFSPRTYTYDNSPDTGPAMWHLLTRSYAACYTLNTSDHQSPINVRLKTVAYTPGVPAVSYIGASSSHVTARFVNDGRIPTLELTSSGRHITGLPHTNKANYQLSQVFVHFGSDHSSGSEHTVNNRYFQGEVQYMHHNTGYGSVDEALGKPGGVVIVSAFVQEIAEPASSLSTELEHLLGYAKYIRYPGESVNVNVSVESLLPESLFDRFVYYMGSLTKPPCTRDILWVLLAKPFNVSTIQMQELRSIYSDKLGFSKISDRGNARPLQPINTRVIRVNFPILTL